MVTTYVQVGSQLREITTSPEVAALIGDRPVLPPPRTRNTWTNSRLVVSGEGETLSVLHLIAEAKFGPWDPKIHYPIWVDRTWTNETFENVKLVERYVPEPRKPSRLGVPSGTPEYQKAYRAANPDKVKKWTKTAYEKNRALKQKLEALENENAALRRGSIEDPKASDLFSRLQGILSTAPEGKDEEQKGTENLP